MRVIIQMTCGKCKRKNYTTTKNKTRTPDKISLKKYCRFCKKHTEHKEAK